MHWGYSARSQTYPAVAAAAKRVFSRVVSPERVKQIYEVWVRRAVRVGYREPGAFTKASRAKHRPEGTIKAQADQLLREYRPGSLERRAQSIGAVRETLRRDQLANTRSHPEPDPLDDPRWFNVGGGVHPDGMNAQQRAAFDALPARVQGEYRKLVDLDEQRVEKEDDETREQLEQWRPYILEPLDAVDRISREHGLYRLPGLGVRYVRNEVRGKGWREQRQEEPQGAAARRRREKAKAAVAEKVKRYQRKALEDMARLTAERRQIRGIKSRK